MCICARVMHICPMNSSAGRSEMGIRSLQLELQVVMAVCPMWLGETELGFYGRAGRTPLSPLCNSLCFFETGSYCVGQPAWNS